jgi:hypothetical protein
LFPVVLPFMELPVVVALAGSPPEAELPPAVAPAALPGLCPNAAVPESVSAVIKARVANLIRFSFRWLDAETKYKLFDRSKKTLLQRDRSRQAVHISQSLNAPAIVFYRVSFDLYVVGFC